jgi:hypothetical protein
LAARAGQRLHHRPRKFLEALAQGLIDFAIEAFKAPASAPVAAELPDALAHVWEWFCELSKARSANGHGLNPISFAEIDAWARVMQTGVTPWEAGLIRRLDAAVLPVLMTAPTTESGHASVKDVKAVESVFAGLKARAAEVFGK